MHAGTLLIVEDSDPVRESIASLLEALGFIVLQATNGQHALELLDKRENSKIDFLISDVVMPKMGGPELAEKLKKRLPNLKVVFMSGYSAEKIAAHLNSSQT